MDGVYSIMTNTHFLVSLPRIFLYSGYTVGYVFCLLFSLLLLTPRIFFLGISLLLESIFLLIIRVVHAHCKEHEKSSRKSKEGNER